MYFLDLYAIQVERRRIKDSLTKIEEYLTRVNLFFIIINIETYSVL